MAVSTIAASGSGGARETGGVGEHAASIANATSLNLLLAMVGAVVTFFSWLRRGL